jgi:hypothetical protein
MKVGSSKTIVEILQSIILSLAAIIGGLWALKLYWSQRTSEAAIEIECATASVPSGTEYLVFFDVSLTNKGHTVFRAKPNGAEPAYHDQIETLKHSVSLQIRQIRPPKTPEELRELSWFDEKHVVKIDGVPEINLLTEYEDPKHGNKIDFWMEPGEVYHLGIPVLLPTGVYLGKITVIGTGGDDNFWSRVIFISVPDAGSKTKGKPESAPPAQGAIHRGKENESMNSTTEFNYSHLSLRDLVEARDMFHAHLINKRNVVATAVGRYLIRNTDLDAHGHFKGSSGGKRTLSNSLVVDISWPCILVFVKEWEDEKTLVGRDTNDLIPKTIYMPDGRMVPVCTVEAPRQNLDNSTIEVDRLRFPDNLIGGGYPLIVHSQGVDRVASVGCVVTDGHDYYALSTKHVTGDGGDAVYSRFGHERRRIGLASGITLGRVPFSRLYPGWICKDTLVKCDVGLIALEDIRRWKTDIFVLGSFSELYDLNTINFGLSLIAEHKVADDKQTTETGKVVAYGAVSGRIEGEITALFYRYKSVGGTEFVSDFLISGRGGTDLKTRHGDSGTLWLLEEPPEPNQKDKKSMLRPIALHWGQHDFFAGQGESKKMQFSYGLATCLSNVCRELDVDIVRGWNVDLPYTWGKVGHYTVAARAINAIQDPKLKGFMEANLAKITFANDQINAGLDTKDNPDLPKDPSKGLCPLGDVPDIIWKQSRKATDYGRMGDENPNHYADADAPSTGGRTLFELCDTADKLTVHVWNAYYDGIDGGSLGMDPGKPISKGLICFRVWQIYDYMIKAMTAPPSERAARFIFAAGVLAHYVGDACQPLHSSYMSDGDPADNQTVQYTAKRTSTKHNKGDVYPKTVNPGSGVHSAYEDAMIDDNIDEIFPKIPNSTVNNQPVPPITSGQTAGFAVLTLMKKTQEDIHPKDIVEAYKAAKSHTDVSEALYQQFGELTIDCLARGSKYLAAIWDAAWTKGDGSNNIANRGAVDDKALVDLYIDRDELPSMHLDTIEPLLT